MNHFGLHLLKGIPLVLIHMGQWSEWAATPWSTLALGNWVHQIELATAQSICSRIQWPPSRLLHQVKRGPKYPKSLNLQSVKQSRNGPIYPSAWVQPPHFSDTSKTSLKSPKASHGCPSMGIKELIVKLDFQMLVVELQHPQAPLSPLGNLLQDIKALMGHFHLCNVQFAHRQCNEATHLLAWHAWNIPDVILWLGDIPDFLFQHVWLDKTSCSSV